MDQLFCVCALITRNREKLLINHAQLISQLEKKIDNYPEYVYHSVSTLSETTFMLSSSMWSRLKACEKGQVATTLCPQQTTTVPLAPELLKLETLSSQLIQHAKYHQTWYIVY